MLLPFFPPLWKKLKFKQLSKLKDKLGPGIYPTFDSGLCRKSYRMGAERGAEAEARAPAGRRAGGGYVPRGSVQSLVDGSLHQEEAGRRPDGGQSGAWTARGRLLDRLERTAPGPGRGAPAGGESARLQPPRHQSWERRQH